MESEPAEWQWTIDTEAPAIVDLLGPPEYTNEEEATLDFACSKEDCTFECRLDYGDFQECESPVTYSELEDGTYRFSVRAIDAFGNMGATETHEWTVDTVLPLVIDLDGPAEQTNSTTATFDFQCSRDNCSFECQLDGSQMQSCAPGVTYEDLEDGQYTFAAVATDELGTVGPPAEWTWTVDTVEPVVEELAGPAELSNETTATLDFECSKEVCQFSCELSGASQGVVELPTDCDSGHTYTDLADDEYTFSVTATDEAGNTSAPESWSWTVYTVEPVVEDISGPAELTDETTATLDFECSKEDCQFSCELSGASQGEVESPTDCDSGHTYTDLADDEYTFSVTATDEAGNTSAPASWSWTVDTVNPFDPIIEILEAPPMETTDDWAAFEFECTNKSSCTFECALDDDDGSGSPQAGDWESCSSPHLVDELELGDYTLHIRATDEDGMQDVASWDWTVMKIEWAAISTGDQHNCGVQVDGTLWCWGSGDDGRLGLGEDRSNREAPTQVGNDSDWKSVSSGVDHTCGVREDSTLWCWGSGDDGRLGLGDESERDTPQQVGGDADWKRVSSGRHHTCGVREDSTLWCWGRNGAGQLGVGDETNRDTPHQVAADTNWESVSSGDWHTCGVQEDSTLWCWGLNTSGQLGVGDEMDRDTPQQVGDDTEWESVSASGTHTCGVREEGTLWCWGSGLTGRLGLGDETSRDAPEQVGDDTNWESVSSSSSHTCGMRSDGTLWCWGAGLYGRLGLGDESSRDTPQQVGDNANWEIASAGGQHTCGVREDSTLWCWGRNFSSLLGLGVTSGSKSKPQSMDSSQNFRTIAAGVTHGCGTGADGTLWCWGSNQYGELGLGEDISGRDTPQQVGEDTDWESVSAGGWQSCGVRDDGTLWCWGRNWDGQLGVGDESDRDTPTQVGEDTDWESVSSGITHACGVREDSTLWCWGRGNDGRLGLGDESDRDTPQQVGDDADWKSVSSGEGHTCGVQDDGTLWCWGAGLFGRLGQGDDESNRDTPTQVAQDTDWKSVSSGAFHTCGVRQDSTLWCWGSGLGGRLGLGDESDRNTPQQVEDDTEWESVSAGGAHTCGVRQDSTLWCWGIGSSGRLGLGDESDRYTPTQVGETTQWDSVSAGTSHTHAIRTTGAGWSWGTNGNGRLGDGTRWKDNPHQVADP